MNSQNDKYADYYLVCEATTSDAKIEVKKQETRNGLNFLRFTAILQAFINERNRNRRKWIPKYVKEALGASTFMELLNKGGVPGENGHPIPPSGEVTMERVATIDPNNISHVIKKVWFENNDTVLKGEIETVDDGDGPGARFMRHIIQGLPTSFSNRAIIPQKKNPDGSTDQTGVGRIITFDRVILPSHPEAYMDTSVPVVQVLKTRNDLKIANECCTYVTEKSNKVRHILDDMDPVFETAFIDSKGRYNVGLKSGDRVITSIEKHLVNEIKSYMMNL